MSENSTPRTLRLYRKFTRFPMGKWLFSRTVCLTAPYFGSISPRFESLEPGKAVVSMKNRRRVRNHIGTVHAIAMCNLCELAAGTMTDVSVPAGMRWIPKGMQVEYLNKATTDLVATAQLPGPIIPGDAFELPVVTEVRDSAGVIVLKATITMWVSPKKQRSD